MAESQKHHPGQYGLIIPKKDKPTPVAPKRTNIFDDDSDEEDQKQDWLQITRKANLERSIQLKESTKVLRKALEEDPSVFEYDEQYDDMVEERDSNKKKEKMDRKPKYITNLLKTAEIRKREYENRVERDVQKEREAEGDEFKDKESFVTGAYRAKMEELQRVEDELKRKDAIDDLTDVTKQADLGGFYRHMFRTTVGDDEKRKRGPEPQEETPTETILKKGLVAGDERHQFTKRSKKEEKPSRGEEKQPTRKDSINQENLEEMEKPSPPGPPEPRREEPESPQIIKSPDPEEDSLKEKQTLPRVCLWKKRTVDEVFDEALQRYLARKENHFLQPAIVTST